MAHAPIVFLVPGDQYTESAVVSALLWEGETTAGDQVELRFVGSDAVLWAGRTGQVHTYMGATISPEGVIAPKGFYVHRLDAGRILVYLKERF